MNFILITDYPFNVKERITPALFDVDFLFRIDKDRVKSYLEEHIEVFNKRALWKFDLNKTLKFIKEKVRHCFAHDYANDIIDVPELSYRIICINCKDTDTLFYKLDLEIYKHLIYFKSNCGYNMIGNSQLITGAMLSALTKEGVEKWHIDKVFDKYIDCESDIDEIIDLLYFDSEEKYLKVTSSDNKMGEVFLFENRTKYFNNIL